MQQNKSLKWLMYLIIGLAVLILGYISYTKDADVRKHGVYSIAKVKEIRLARNGWKVTIQYSYNNIQCVGEGLNDIEDFGHGDSGKRYFVKFQPTDPDGSHILIPKIEVPDSLGLPPIKGWSEEWMLEHFPKVVEYVHDTR